MDEEKKILRQVFNHNAPILFLGAGFSLGAKTKFNKAVPTGSQLIDIILNDFLNLKADSDDYKELKENRLYEVCQYAQNERSPNHLTDFLQDYFSDLEPAAFHKEYASFKWSKIYSTNIDDLVESIYKDSESKLIIHNSDRPNTLKDNSRVEFFKLHGCVKNPSQRFVFSSDEYIDSMIKSKDYRFSSLGFDIQSQDFIFVGSDFNDFNIEYYLKLYESAGFSSSRGKLIFINPCPKLYFKSQVKKAGGVIIKWTGEQFSDFLKEYTESNTQPALPKIFGFKNLKEIKDSFSLSKSYNSKLYLGFPPSWLDVFHEWDIINPSIIEEFNKIRISYINQDINHFIFALYGKAFIGKSVYLKRIGIDLFNEGYDVHVFEGKYFDHFNFLQYLRGEKDKDRFALLIDNASYQYGVLKILINNCPKDKELIIVTTSRPFFHLRKRYHIVENEHYELFIEPGIEKSFAQNITKKLSDKGFAGDLSKKKTDEAKLAYIQKENDISTLLFKLTYGSGFIKRFKDDLLPRIKTKSKTKEILVKLAIFHKLDLPYLPIELLNLIYRNETSDLVRLIDDLVKYNEYNGIEIRNEFLIQHIFKATSYKEIINNIQEILINIAPQVDDSGHSYWNEILASLIKEKLLRKRLNLYTGQIKQMLYELNGYYGDNFNYWLQLGIAEQMESEYEKALNHFRQAESANPNSYMVQNAIGRNFLKQANSMNKFEMAKPYFDEGESIMIDLIKNKEEFQVKAFSTHCYLYEKINFLKKFKQKVHDKELRQLFGYLEYVIQRDPEDAMAKHISNHFFNFLKSIGKTGIVSINYQDISRLKSLLFATNLDTESLFEEFELD